MSQFWSFARTLIASLVIVLLLQIHVSGKSLEQRAVSLATHSVILEPIDSVVDASVISITRVWDRVTNQIKSRTQRAGSREEKFRIDRHPDVTRESND